jgi:hypothetical protein
MVGETYNENKNENSLIDSYQKFDNNFTNILNNHTENDNYNNPKNLHNEEAKFASNQETSGFTKLCSGVKAKEKVHEVKLNQRITIYSDERVLEIQSKNYKSQIYKSFNINELILPRKTEYKSATSYPSKLF